MNDTLIGLFAYALTIFLLWLATRKDPRLGKQWRRPWGILLRMFLFFALLQLILIALPFPVWQSYLFLLLIIAFTFGGAFPSCDFIVVGAILWTIYQWAFWFPVRDEVILTYPAPAKKAPTTKTFSRYGTAITGLKPIGKVLIDGVEQTAISTLGYIEAGERITVEDSNGPELRVSKADPL